MISSSLILAILTHRPLHQAVTSVLPFLTCSCRSLRAAKYFLNPSCVDCAYARLSLRACLRLSICCILSACSCLACAAPGNSPAHAKLLFNSKTLSATLHEFAATSLLRALRLCTRALHEFAATAPLRKLRFCIRDSNSFCIFSRLAPHGVIATSGEPGFRSAIIAAFHSSKYLLVSARLWVKEDEPRAFRDCMRSSNSFCKFRRDKPQGVMPSALCAKLLAFLCACRAANL